MAATGPTIPWASHLGIAAHEILIGIDRQESKCYIQHSKIFKSIQHKIQNDDPSNDCPELTITLVTFVYTRLAYEACCQSG